MSNVYRSEDGSFPTSDRLCCVFIVNTLGADWYFAYYRADTESWTIEDHLGDFEFDDVKYWFFLPQVSLVEDGIEDEE